jgi:structural maintenance of chromosome 2
MKSSQQDVVAANEAVVVAEKALKAATEEEEEITIKVGDLKASYDEAKATLDEIEKNLKSCSDELKALSKEKARLAKKAESAEIDGKKLSVKISKFHTEKGKAEKFLSSMTSKYPWIESEKEAFGIPGGDYDFEESNPAEMSKHLKELQAEQTSLVRFIQRQFTCYSSINLN